MSSSSSNRGGFSIMDRDFCSLLSELQSEKVTVRQKAFNKLVTILSNREDDFLTYINSESFETEWSTVFDAIYEGMVKQSSYNTAQTMSKNHDYILALPKLLELAMGREIPQLTYSQMIRAFTMALSDQSMRNNFGSCILQLLQKYVLSSAWPLTAVTHQEWSDILDRCFAMLDLSQLPIKTTVGCASLAVSKFLENCAERTMLACYLPVLIDHMRRTKNMQDNEKKIVSHELVVTAFHIVQAIAVDCKTSVLEFLESFLPFAIDAYQGRLIKEQKHALFRLMHLSLIVLYPGGKSLADAERLTKDDYQSPGDDATRRKTLQRYHTIVTSEIEALRGSENGKEGPKDDVFVDFAARLCYTFYWNEDNWRDAGSSESSAKRNKQYNKLQSIMEMVSPKPNQFSWRWFEILSIVLNRYSSALTNEDYPRMLQLLCDFQASLQTPLQQNAFYRCCAVLLKFEASPTFRTLSTRPVNEATNSEALWCKIFTAASRGCTTTSAKTSVESNLLLQLLIRHRKYPSVSFLNATVLEAFYTYAIEKTNVNVGTILAILETLGSIEHLGDVDGVLTKLLNYLFPQTRALVSKDIVNSKERIHSKVLAGILVLCVVTRHVSGGSDESVTVKHGDNCKDLYQEENVQLQVLEQQFLQHDLVQFIRPEHHQNGSEFSNTTNLKFNVNEQLLKRVCEVINFDKHTLPEDDSFLYNALVRICYDVELYLEMVNILVLHQAYDEAQYTKCPLDKKTLFKFQQLNLGFERLIDRDVSLNVHEVTTIGERLLAIFRGPYHPLVGKLLKTTDHTMVLRWTVEQVVTDGSENSTHFSIPRPNQLSEKQAFKRCFLHILAEYVQYDGACFNEVYDLLDRLELNVHSSLDLFYFFDICRILLRQPSQELVANWAIRKFVEVCQNHYTNAEISEMIIDLYADFTTYISPYDGMVRNATIILNSYVKQCTKRIYSIGLQAKIIAQIKHLLKAYPFLYESSMHENIYLGLVPLLRSSNYQIKLEAARNILYIMQTEWAFAKGTPVPGTFYEFQSKLYETISFDELATVSTDLNEHCNIVSACLQLLIGVFCVSYALRRKALYDIVLLVHSANVNDGKITTTIRSASAAIGVDFGKLLRANMDKVLMLWLAKGYRLKHFPYRLARNIASVEEFVQLQKKSIGFVVLAMQPKQFVQFCDTIGLQQSEMVKSILPKCVSFLLPQLAKCTDMAPKYNAMANQMKEGLASYLNAMDLNSHTFEIIKDLTKRLSDSEELGNLSDQCFPKCFVDELSLNSTNYTKTLEYLKQSICDSPHLKYKLLSNLCFKNAATVEHILTDVKRRLWDTEELQQKMIHLFQYAVLLDHLKEYIIQQKEKSLKPYIVRDTVHFLCNLLTVCPGLRLATLNSFERFLEHVLPAEDASELLAEHLHFIVSTLLEIEDVEPSSAISHKSLSLLRHLILDHSSKFATAIGKLNYLPNDDRFEELRMMITQHKATIDREKHSMRGEITSIMQLPNLRYEDLAALRIILSNNKIDLKTICDEMSIEGGSVEVDGNENILHRLINILLEVVRNAPFDKRSVEALRCLAEIGPIDLGTMLLKSDTEMIAYDKISNSKEAIERCTDVLLSELDVLLTSKNHSVAYIASHVCYNLLYGKSLHALAAKFPMLHPFMGNSTEEIKLFSYNAGSVPSLKATLGNGCINCREFVQNLSSALLSFLGNPILKKLVELDSAFAEKIIPLLIQIALKLFVDRVNIEIGNFINFFFEKFSTTSEDSGNLFNDPKALQLMLTIVECVRVHNHQFPQFKITINFLPIARASQYCQAHFKAILYGELWYREEVENNAEDTKKNPKLREIMKSCHHAIGVYDAVQSFLNPILERTEYYRLERNYAGSLIYHDTNRGSRNCGGHIQSKPLMNLLKDSNLYGLARSLHPDPQEVDYECAWRLADWDVLVDGDKSDGQAESMNRQEFSVQSHFFERAHYKALKCLVLQDELAMESAIHEGRRAVSEIFKLTSIESTKHVYGGLCRLRQLQQIEDFGLIHFKRQIDCEQDLLNRWNQQDALPCSDFALMERLLSQRLSIFKTAGVCAKRQWIPAATYSTLLRLIHESRLRGYNDCALRNIALTEKLDLPANVRSLILLEDAQLNWTTGHRQLARGMAREVMDSKQYNDLMVNAVACRVYGEFQAEGHLQEVHSLYTDYFQRAEKCIQHALAKQSTVLKTGSTAIPLNHRCFEVDRNFTVQHTVAKYADREFVRLSKILSSQEWEARRLNLTRMQQETERLHAEASRATDKRRKEIGRTLQFTQKNLKRDQKAAEEVEQNRSKYLTLALAYYMTYAVQTTVESDMVIFRIISLWLNNHDAKDVKELVTKSLHTIPSYKFIAVLPQLTPRVSSEGTVGMLVKKTLILCAKDHPHHTLPHVFAQLHAFQDQPEHEVPTDDKRLQGVREVYNKLKQEPTLQKILHQMERMNLALIEMANKTISTEATFREYTMIKRDKLGQLENLDLVHCPTVQLTVVPGGNYQNRTVGIRRWDVRITGVGGINAPKKLSCLCLNGTKQTQLLKGKDDMRQDAVMQQVFGILNVLLRHDRETARRKLSVRTYKVVPLSRQSGILEWCNNTMPIGTWLLAGHVKYRPQDIDPSTARKKFTNNAQAGMTVDKKLQNYADICRKLQPVLRHYFLEHYPKPGVWFERQQNYIKSVATSSMIGYVLGIGDRHVQNILIDKCTAEVIHIDFGIAFEMGKNLFTPETVPFRLTRDIVDGMGINGVEGVFKKSCEKTLEVLRNNQTVILTILEVLLYDPLYSWNVLSNKKANRRQQQAAMHISGEESDSQEQVDLTVGANINVTAERTLMQVEKKLQGKEDDKYISVEGQVQMLIFNATNEINLCQLFAGWQPYL
ncbi:serine/threonine-protein kinase ATM [Anopheles nili]|uniref:serine/threonine-protein kinase ATM n=1 Tax=Anopheles nili TaxID=185578 RepID=UPI00237BD5C4|nr:serine/threonine-protein kinase ATM [Anopheles nili]